MPTQLLFYSSATPISLKRHKKAAVEPLGDYRFAARTNSVPLMAVEFAKAAREYALIFAGDKERVMPAAILGVQNDTNLYVDDEGQWNARYVPAFVRRYPFVFSSGDEGKTFSLCIDEDYAGVNQNGRGHRLFDDEGERTDYLNGVLDFLKEYQKEYNRTQLFCSKLVELDLLEPMQAQIKLKSGQQLSLTGFQAVSREKLNALAPEKLSELAKMGALELIYVHLFSMRNFSEMIDRFATSVTKQDGTPEERPTQTEKKKTDLEHAEAAGTA